MALKFRTSTKYMTSPCAYLMPLTSIPAGYIKDCDFVSRSLADSIMIFMNVECDGLFGYNTGDETYEEKDLGYRRSYSYNPMTDWSRYGATFHTLRQVLRGGENHFSPDGEHEISHYQSVGQVVPTGGSIRAYGGPTGGSIGYPSGYSSSFSLPTTGYTVPSYNYRLWSRYVNSITRSYDLQYLGIIGAGPEFYANRNLGVYNSKLCGRWTQGSSFTSSGTKGSWTYTSNHSNIQWTFDGSQLLVSYRFSVSSNQPGFGSFELIARHRFTLKTRFAPGQRSFPSGVSSEYFGANDLFYSDCSLDYEVVSTSTGFSYQMKNGTVYGKGDHIVFPGQGQGRYSCDPFTRAYVSSSLGAQSATIYNSTRTSIEGNFRQWFERNLPDIRACTALSTADAMTKLASSPNTDVLQNLVKLNDIASQVPHIEEAVAALRKLANRDLSSISDIITFLTSLRLQYGFQWRPEYDLLMKYLPQLPDILLTFTKSSPRLLGYGKAEYDFKALECYRTTHLVVRTKIVASSELNQGLATYLRLDSIGITPSPANIWDIIPFSFVVNWFTNMGARIRHLGTLANFWLLDPIVIVHTFMLTSNYSQAEMDAMHLQAAPGTDPVYMKLFHREVTRYVALPRTSKFDFEGPARPPDWSTVASLLWQWMA